MEKTLFVPIWGLPNSGKTTSLHKIIKILSEALGSENVGMFSAKDWYLKYLKENGRDADWLKKVVENGDIPESNEHVSQSIQNAIFALMIKKVVLLDGIKTVKNFQAMQQLGLNIKIAGNIIIPPEVCIERAAMRKSCYECGTSHVLLDICPNCGSPTHIRGDEENIIHRIVVHYSNTIYAIEEAKKSCRVFPIYASLKPEILNLKERERLEKEENEKNIIRFCNEILEHVQL